jgi:ribosomal protein S12 methylthiotransferase accessory factor YcaO
LIDYWRTLAPGTGFAKEVVVLPPKKGVQPLWTVLVDVGQRGWNAAGREFAFDWVGACGVDRNQTYIRAAGEAVERAALLPSKGLSLAAADKKLSDPWRKIGVAPFAVVESFCSAITLPERDEVAIPEVAVSYPAQDDIDRSISDPSPSGAAAGESWEAAVASALLELIERDLVCVAWRLQVPMVAIQVQDFADRSGTQSRYLRTLLAGAGQLGIELVFGALPTCIPGHPVVVAVARDLKFGVVSVGAALSAESDRSVLRAAQEAVQMRNGLVALVSHYGADVNFEGTVRTDVDRARWWVSGNHPDQLWRWAQSFMPELLEFAETPVTTPQIVDTIRSEGHHIAIVDLLPRLPDAVRALGWSAVRAFVSGYQPLRVDEGLDWTWSEYRLQTAADRWAGRCGRLPEDPERADPLAPHPLI